MIPLLRTVAILNAAIWLGASVFFAFVVAPTLLAPEMKRVLTDYWAGYATQAVISKLFWFQHICALIALVHLVAEFLYIGRPIERAVLWVLLSVFGLGLFGGFVLQPKLREEHFVKHNPRSTLEQRAAAARSFGLWHGVSQAGNLFVLGGIAFYLWRVTATATVSRSMTIPRFSAP